MSIFKSRSRVEWLGALAFSTGIIAGVTYTPADAASRMCAKRDLITKMLTDKYKESPRAIGLTEKGKSAFEFHVSEKGTWTITMTNTSGLTCIMAAGHSWQEADKLAFLPKS